MKYLILLTIAYIRVAHGTLKHLLVSFLVIMQHIRSTVSIGISSLNTSLEREVFAVLTLLQEDSLKVRLKFLLNPSTTYVISWKNSLSSYLTLKISLLRSLKIFKQNSLLITNLFAFMAVFFVLERSVRLISLLSVKIIYAAFLHLALTQKCVESDLVTLAPRKSFLMMLNILKKLRMNNFVKKCSTGIRT